MCIAYELKWQSESINEIVNQVAMQVITVIMMVFRDTETGPSWPQLQSRGKIRDKEIESWYWKS